MLDRQMNIIEHPVNLCSCLLLFEYLDFLHLWTALACLADGSVAAASEVMVMGLGLVVIMCLTGSDLKAVNLLTYLVVKRLAAVLAAVHHLLAPKSMMLSWLAFSALYELSILISIGVYHESSSTRLPKE